MILFFFDFKKENLKGSISTGGEREREKENTCFTSALLRSMPFKTAYA